MEYEGIYRRRRDPIRIGSIEELYDHIRGGARSTGGIPLDACRDLVAAIEKVAESDWPADMDKKEVLADKDELSALTEEIYKLLDWEGTTPQLIGWKCFELGRLVERILVRQYEPYVVTARKIKENPESGARRTQRLEGVTSDTIRSEVSLLLSQGRGEVEAFKEIARQYGVSWSTIRRRYKDQ